MSAQAPPAPSMIIQPPQVQATYLGKTPTSINQILLSGGAKATHFTGPVVSGNSAHEVLGSALLAMAISVDYTMGNFSLPIQFPTDSLLLYFVTMPYAAFAGGTGDTQVQLGTASGRNDIATANGFGALHTITINPVQGTLPFSVDPNPFQCWITVNNEGNTAGKGVVLLTYARLAQAWS